MCIIIIYHDLDTYENVRILLFVKENVYDLWNVHQTAN